MNREDRSTEKEAVRTTIVGGRPPGSGKAVGPIPRGIEVLVKKAAVDGVFKEVLLAKRAKAADEIALKLEPAEVAMINAVPTAQLETIIANSNVTDLTRAAFLGRAAAVMLAALGVSSISACAEEHGPPVTGVRPEPTPKPEPKPAEPTAPNQPVTEGIRPDRPEPKEEPNPDPDQVTRGIRPDVPVKEETQPEPRPDLDHTTRGVRPDLPVTKGIKPDPIPSAELSAEEIRKRVEAMVKLMASPDENIHTEARQALVGMGPAILPALKEIKPPTPDVAKEVHAIIQAFEEKR